MRGQYVNIGIIGLGRISKVHIVGLSNIKEANLVAVCDIDEKKVARTASRLKVKGFSKHEELTDDPQVEAVVVLTPPRTHFDIVRYALEANKHVFCEKPITATVEEGKRMAELVSDCNVKFQVGFTERFNEGSKAVRRAIRDSKIGEPLSMRAKRDIPKNVIKENWLADPHEGGGPIIECLIHDIDLARWYFDSEVRQVFASGVKALGQYIDNVSVLLEFKNGCIANLSSSWTLPNTKQWQTHSEIIGTKGFIEVYSPPRGWVTLVSEEEMIASYPFPTSNLSEGGEQSCGMKNLSLDLPHYSMSFGAYMSQLKHFINCILKDKPARVGIEDGLIALEVATAALQSLKEGKPVIL